MSAFISYALQCIGGNKIIYGMTYRYAAETSSLMKKVLFVFVCLLVNVYVISTVFRLCRRAGSEPFSWIEPVFKKPRAKLPKHLPGIEPTPERLLVLEFIDFNNSASIIFSRIETVFKNKYLNIRIKEKCIYSL